MNHNVYKCTLSENNMVKHNVNLHLGADNLEQFNYYCKKSGRKISNLAVLAIREYIIRNPLK